MFDGYESHLVSKETQNTIAESDWSYVDMYMKWFFRVSYPYIVQAALGDPPRSAHQEILQDGQTHLYHADDVLPKYHRIVEIAQASINRCIFLDESDVRQVYMPS